MYSGRLLSLKGWRGWWIILDIQLMADLLGTLYNQRSHIRRRLKGVIDTHMETSILVDSVLRPITEVRLTLHISRNSIFNIFV